MTETAAYPLSPALRATIESRLVAWDRRLRSTSRADRREVEAAVCRMYERCGMLAPKNFVWMGSPIGAQFAADLLSGDPVAARMFQHMSDEQSCTYRREIEAQIDPEYWSKPRLNDPKLTDRTTGPSRAADAHGDSHPYIDGLIKLWTFYIAPFGGDDALSSPGLVEVSRIYASQGQEQTLSVWISLLAQRRVAQSGRRFFNSNLCSRFGRNLAARRDPRFERRHHDHGDADLRRWTTYELFGTAATIAHAADIATVVEYTSYIEALPGVAVLAENPVLYTTDKDGMLHNAAGPAVRFSDGVEVYSWRGRWVDRDVIEQPVSLEAIVTERNAEVRRCLIERWGWDTFVRKAHLQPVGTEVEDPGNAPHTLQLYDIPGRLQLSRRNPARLLMCTNGSSERDGTRRRYGLLVRAAHTDPVDAAAELYGVSPKTYRRMQVRT
ncbi:DUF6745 domain-containing protein [Mycobacterium sp. D16R24]|uniref:DUF6745 domain-containing protein n=1 Tax=Mycobacterium sp. D16R24 TaxID=1855656 RepID=UPI0011179587|nr:hypothetical protein [Mycobacterium sp. D16R24]